MKKIAILLAAYALSGCAGLNGEGAAGIKYDSPDAISRCNINNLMCEDGSLTLADGIQGYRDSNNDYLITMYQKGNMLYSIRYNTGDEFGTGITMYDGKSKPKYAESTLIDNDTATKHEYRYYPWGVERKEYRNGMFAEAACTYIYGDKSESKMFDGLDLRRMMDANGGRFACPKD